MTRNPTGEFDFRQTVSAGNHNYFRTYTHIDTPEVAGFSAYGAFVHEERDGDIDNEGDTEFHFSRDIAHEPETMRSADTLGAKDIDSVLLAVAWNPTDDFSLTYNTILRKIIARKKPIRSFGPIRRCCLRATPWAPLAVTIIRTAIVQIQYIIRARRTATTLIGATT